MNGQKINKVGVSLLMLTVVWTVLFPPITVYSSFPKVELSDVTIVLLTIYSIGLKRGALIDVFIKYKWLFLSLIGLVVTASVSIIFNERISQYRDWFEPIKYIKLTLFLAYTMLYLKDLELNKLVKYLFFCVVIFNLFHYFNLFYFNDYIEVFYAPKHHLDFFGLNSIGEPATRRMLGTLGNPNNNAILFLLFIIYFFPKRMFSLGENHLYVSIAALFVLACQSRTGLITLILIFAVNIIIHKISWRSILFYIGTIGLGYIVLQLSGNAYLESLADISLLESAKRGRFEQWILILNEMPGKWVLGHGVNKAFLEERHVYAESEYMLILFRYGLVGIVSYTSICLVLFRKILPYLNSKGGMMTLNVLILMLISGITNSPFHVVKLSVLVIVVMGIGLNFIDEEKN